MAERERATRTIHAFHDASCVFQFTQSETLKFIMVLWPNGGYSG